MSGVLLGFWACLLLWAVVDTVRVMAVVGLGLYAIFHEEAE